MAEGLLRFSFSRSGGPGGQNVNKVATRAELRIAVRDLPISPRAAERLRALAGRRVTAEDELILVAESERSQIRNRQECLDRLREMLIQAIPEPKVRRKTKPTRGSKERRLAEKKGRGEVKRLRRGDGD